MTGFETAFRTAPDIAPPIPQPLRHAGYVLLAALILWTFPVAARDAEVPVAAAVEPDTAERGDDGQHHGAPDPDGHRDNGDDADGPDSAGHDDGDDAESVVMLPNSEPEPEPETQPVGTPVDPSPVGPIVGGDATAPDTEVGALQDLPLPPPSQRDPQSADAAILEALAEAARAPVTLPGSPMQVANISVRPGTRGDFRLQTSEDFMAGNVEAWGMVLHGNEPGPVLCLTGGIHGDELNGVEIVRQVIETESPSALRGTLVGVPIVNISGFVNQSRYLPDRRDLNRYFPGRANGSIASRIAWELWSKVIVHCTHLIDLHTGSHNRTNLPQIRGDLENSIVMDMARAFDARVVIHNPGQDGTLRSAASRAGIAAVLYEAGETLRFQADEIELGVKGVRNVMRALGMRRSRPANLGDQMVFRETRWLRADRGGILDLRVKPGDSVKVGDVVGVISDPLRRTRGDLVSKRRGRVIGVALLPMVAPGMAVVHLGVPGSTITTAEMDDELDAERPE